MLLLALVLSLLAHTHAWAVAAKFDVQSKVPLTPALRAATDDKLGKQLDRYDKYLNSVTVNLKVERRAVHDTEHRGKEAHIAEVTALCTDKQVIRVSHECDDMYASLDILADQLARKLRKHKEKLSKRKNDNMATSDVFEAEDPEPDSVDAE
mmetsp:Transcript_14463/g.31323  ORF Transcript_14463/g.31323 Transcript_14463/m.31323 type:complete len:152 (+) Transcript_14463:61-516(+)